MSGSPVAAPFSPPDFKQLGFIVHRDTRLAVLYIMSVHVQMLKCRSCQWMLIFSLHCPCLRSGFGGLMVTTLISYLSHSQVWALQEGGYLYVAGRSNRAQLSFGREMDEILEAVPEVPPSPVQAPGGAASRATATVPSPVAPGDRK